jgi:PAS domain S-box-containing protein
MLSRTTPARQKVLFWSAIFLVGAASLLSFLSTQRLQTLAQEEERSQDILLQISRLVSSLKDVETGTRGYLISGDGDFLEPYRAGRDGFGEYLRLLQNRVSDNRVLGPGVQRLASAGRQRIAISDRIVGARLRGETAADQRPLENSGKMAMDRVRLEARGLVDAENALIRQREDATARQVLGTNIVLALGDLMSLTILILLFISRGREVDRRRAAEGELRELNAELEERVQSRTAEVRRSGELLDAVLENLPDTVFLKDLKDEFRYLFVNRAGEALFGRARSDLIGHLDHELFPSEQADHCREGDLGAAESRGGIARVEHQVTAAGTRILESNKVPIADVEGEPRFLLGIVRDVTEQRSTEDQLRQMQRMDAVGQLTGGIAHDFNNLLTVIMNSAEVLKASVQEDPLMAEVAEDAIGAVLRGSDLVRRLLAFARIQQLEPRSVDLNRRLANISPLLQRTLGERINLRVQPGQKLWSALVDPTQVDDAIINLAINARDAMRGDGSLSIETANVTLDEEYAAHHIEVDAGDYVMLAVSDTGAGMTPETIARAFEPFFTTKPDGMGTGLGLSQVYGWAKQSAGHIKIYSELGHGTTIKLYLPKAKKADDDPDAASERLGEIKGGKETVLVVEDNPKVRKALVRNLDSLGYRSLEASSGHEAMGIVRLGSKFDLLLTDIVMPGGMTGYQLAAAIEELRPGQKVLFTSGYTELATDGTLGRVPLLSKPYRKRDLAEALRSALESDADGPLDRGGEQ